MGVNLGFINIHLYSITMLLGVVCGYFIIKKEAQKQRFDNKSIDDLLFAVTILGIIGSRLYYVLFNLDDYGNIMDIFKIWEGGLAIHGAIIGGLVYLIIYCYQKKLNLLKMLDIFVPGLILGQAIGRWGNFFNHEAYGSIVSLDYLKGLFLPQFVIDGMFINGNYHHPTFLYESILCLIGFGGLMLIRKRNLKTGFLIGLYLIYYGIIRFFIESLRTDSLMFFNLKVAQIVSIIMILLGIFILLRKGDKSAKV